MKPTFRCGNDLPLQCILELYQATDLAEHRPLSDPVRMESMIRNSNLVISAWVGEELVGLARTLTDFTFVGYLADLLVHDGYQRKGIGKQLICETRARMSDQSKLILLSLDSSNAYYRHIGFTEINGAWRLRGTDPFCAPSADRQLC